jgi:hypothetical protein
MVLPILTIMKKARYGDPRVNDKILKIVFRHLNQRDSEKLFEDLSKIGGARIKGAANVSCGQFKMRK